MITSLIIALACSIASLIGVAVLVRVASVFDSEASA